MKKFYFVILVFLILLTIGQIVKFKAYPVMSETFQGIILPTTTNFEQISQITLQSSIINERISILNNGKVIGNFVENIATFNVSDNSLIEIDGTAEKEDFSVEIMEKSSNIKQYFGNNDIIIQKNIVVLDRFFIE